MNSDPALLEFKNVAVMRGNKVVLDGLNLLIGSKERCAILGPNGCGKSTLIRTITRECYPLIKPDSSLKIMGETNWNVSELRSMLGIVSNDLMASVTGEATALDVVLSGFFSSTAIYDNHDVTEEQTGRALETLARLQILHLAARPVEQMSSGEARRILIARALVHRPRALLFDEPSNSLDIAARHSLRQTMSVLAKSGVGIIVVTHDLSDIVSAIDRVLLMQDGQIVADGTKRDLLQRHRLSELFRTSVEVLERDGLYHAW